MTKHKMRMHMKSGKEFKFFCTEYTISKNKVTGELVAFNCKEVKGDCPVFFNIADVESISEVFHNGIKDWFTCKHPWTRIQDYFQRRY